MTEKYFSYLLRIWHRGSQEDPIWRVMLEDPHSREVFGFDGLDAFINFLQNLAVEQPADPTELD
jgi:hypothetical protein